MCSIDGVQFLRPTRDIRTSIVVRGQLIPFQGKSPSFDGFNKCMVRTSANWAIPRPAIIKLNRKSFPWKPLLRWPIEQVGKGDLRIPFAHAALVSSQNDGNGRCKQKKGAPLILHKLCAPTRRHCWRDDKAQFEKTKPRALSMNVLLLRSSCKEFKHLRLCLAVVFHTSRFSRSLHLQHNATLPNSDLDFKHHYVRWLNGW